ncbi:MAG: ABC transporter ATP-binding protein [Chloroflexi bacterium]|nr:MAG: ABC transporter ATP-binding protein [Chloroflexota bacterium]TMG70145.1 MAG: ABC transporter ATP-binding protein [Chloroflexota bacterium]
MRATAVKLEARRVAIHYRRQRSGLNLIAVDGVDLRVDEGEFLSIVGPSGCGKTTFLNAVDGLIPIASGSLLLDGNEISSPGPDRAMVFQQPSLLPWRTVTRNVVYGLEMQHRAGRESRETAARLIDLVGLQGFADAWPSELSGGMQQRVNLARALATDPEVLLLDEPFAALDAQTRETMQQELLRIWGATRKTAIFITHDITEAVYLADRVIVFTARPGRIKLDVKIELPRPRDLRLKRDARFIDYERMIWETIREEVIRSESRGQAIA